MSRVQIRLPSAVRQLPIPEKIKLIETLSKAMDITPEKRQAGRGMWDASDDPFIAKLEDDFYKELSQTAQQGIADVMGMLKLPVEELQKSNPISRLVAQARQRRGKLKTFLQRATTFSIEQLQKVDKVFRSKIPDLEKWSERFVVRAALLGKIREVAEREKLTLLGDILDRLPNTVKAAKQAPFPFQLWEGEKQAEIVSLSPREFQSLEHSVLQAGEKLKEISDRHRAGVKQLVIQAQKERWGAHKLSQALFDVYGDHNRDWRRVAITELAMATNDGYLVSIQAGDIVQVATMSGACTHCQRVLEGHTFTVSDVPMADGDTYVWAGKSNMGRKVTDWWACVPLHPHCRHRWFRVPNEGG